MAGTPPPPPPPPSRKPARRRLWYLAAALLGALTLATVVWLGVRAAGGFATMLSLDYFEAPGTTTINLDKAGKYSIYVQTGFAEQRGPLSYTERHSPPDLRLSVVRTGDRSELALSGGDPGFTLTINDRHYNSVKVFTLDRPGQVTVTASLPEDAGDVAAVPLAIGPLQEVGDLFKSIGAVFALLGVAVVGGGGTLLLLLVASGILKRP